LKLWQLPNLPLLMLLARSPKLNPVEQVWQLRNPSLANRCYDNDEQIVNACCDDRDKFTQISDAIRAMCSPSWACLMPNFNNDSHGISMSPVHRAGQKRTVGRTPFSICRVRATTVTGRRKNFAAAIEKYDVKIVATVIKGAKVIRDIHRLPDTLSHLTSYK
jgi:hypothetical protein